MSDLTKTLRKSCDSLSYDHDGPSMLFAGAARGTGMRMMGLVRLTGRSVPG
jgi:hypothetical protein